MAAGAGITDQYFAWNERAAARSLKHARRGIVALALTACAQAAPDPPLTKVFATPFSAAAAPSSPDKALAPLPQHVQVDRRKAALGLELFDDTRLSGDGQVACSSCHSFEHGGALSERYSTLPGRPAVAVNVPSIFNASFNARFAWNGRFTDIGEQLDTAMRLPSAMASSWQAAADTLSQDAALVDSFVSVYPNGISAGALREVMALFCLSLITPNARFDRSLRGELQLSATEQHGYELFREYGCVSCHQGVNIGGNLLQRFGVVDDFFALREQQTPADRGLYEVTHDAADMHVFRVPSLRNVALTAPYFHDGSAPDLQYAVRDMASFQLGRTLNEDESTALVAFLKTLTGELTVELL